MAYKVDVDVELLKEAQSFKAFKGKTRQEIVTHALEEYIRRRNLPEPLHVKIPCDVEDPIAYIRDIKKQNAALVAEVGLVVSFERPGEEVAE
jgi:hypothetical protein